MTHSWSWCGMTQPMARSRLWNSVRWPQWKWIIIFLLWSVSYTDPRSESDAFSSQWLPNKFQITESIAIYVFPTNVYVCLNRTVSARNKLNKFCFHFLIWDVLRSAVDETLRKQNKLFECLQLFPNRNFHLHIGTYTTSINWEPRADLQIRLRKLDFFFLLFFVYLYWIKKL